MADEIRTELGFEAQAAIATLTRMKAELDAYNAAMAAAATSTGRYNRSGAQFDKTAASAASSIRTLSAEAQNFNKTAGAGVGQTTVLYDQYGNVLSTVGKKQKEAASSADDLGNRLEDAGRKGRESGKAVLLTWQSVARIFAIQTIHRFITLVTDAFADGLNDARAYQVSLAEVQTIGKDLNLSLTELDDRVRSLSEQFAQPLEVVSEGLYQTLSNQVADGAQAFEFLATANKFAVAAVTDTGSAVNLLSSAINAYGFSAAEADTVAGKLFKTIELGRIRGEEFANTYGRVLVLSSQLGVSFDEVNAAVATLTVQGLKYNEAFTLINNINLKLIRPTEALQETFNEMGVASAEAGIQAFGFSGFLEQLTDRAGDSASEIGELFNRVRAVRGVLGLAGNATEKMVSNLKELQAAGEVDLQEAFDTIFETDAKRFEQEITRIRNVFVSSFGQGAIRTLNAFFNAFGGGPETIQALTSAIVVAGAAYLNFSIGIITRNTLVSLSFKGLLASVVKARIALMSFLATPLGAALAIGAAVAAIVVSINNIRNAAKRAAEEVKKEQEELSKIALTEERLRQKAAEGSQQEILSSTQRFLQERQKLWLQDARFAEELQDAVFGSIADQVDDRLGAYESFVQGIRDVSADAADNIRDLQQQLLGAQFAIEKFNFDRSLRGLNDQQKIFKQIERSQSLLGQSAAALQRGDAKRAEELRKQAESVAKEALSTADTSKNRASIFRATQQVQRALAQQQRIIEEQIEKEQEQVQIADKIRAQEEARRTRIEVLQQKIKELTDIVEKGEVKPDIDLDTIRDQVGKLTKQLDAELEAAGKNARILEAYDPDVGALRQKFREAFRDPITGIEIDLTDVVDINLQRILNKLNAQADAIPDSQKLAFEKLTGVEIGARGFKDAQEALPEIERDLERAKTATQDIIIATKDWTNALTDARTAAVDVVDTAIQIGRQTFARADPKAGWFSPQFWTALASQVANTGRTLAFNAGIFKETEFQALDPVLKGIVTRFIQFQQVAEKALSAETFDASAAAEATRSLRDLANEAEMRGFPDLAKQIREASSALGTIVTEAEKAAGLQVVAETLTPLEDRIKAVGEAFGQQSTKAQDAGTAGQNAGRVAASGQAALKGAVEDTNASLQRQIDLQSQAGAAQNRAFGGLMRRMGGLAYLQEGGMPAGTDRLPAMLSAGESVNTAAATRDFFPQIQAMNAGIRPVFRDQGGEVTNVGPISISVSETTNARETAREIMKQFKRETRRSTYNARRTGQ
jgi:TP901 family phage tail tape measure protein